MNDQEIDRPAVRRVVLSVLREVVEQAEQAKDGDAIRALHDALDKLHSPDRKRQPVRTKKILGT